MERNVRGQDAKGGDGAQAVELGQYVIVSDVAIVKTRLDPVVVYGAALVIAVTWPFFVPGEAFALRDMVVFDQMALTRASLGYGDLPARNVPQDALLGILPHPVLALRVIMVAAAVAAATSAYRLGRTRLGQAAAMTVILWNPFVVERLLQGHWSVVAAAWLLPAVAMAAPPVATLSHWLASLTPTGAVAAALFARGKRGALVTAMTCAPWVVAGAVGAAGGAAESTGSAASAAAFAPRAETFAGTLGALMGLGGIWNAEAVPASRHAGFAVFGVVLLPVLAAGWRAVPRRWLAAAALGFAVPLASWAGLLTPLIEHVPGGGLLRDAHKFLILTLPALTAAAGALNAKLAGAALALAILQVPDAPLALAQLSPTAVTVPPVDHRGRDVFIPGHATLEVVGGRPVVSPAPKAMNVVEQGALVVDGVVVDEPSPRWVAAQRAYEAGDLGALRELGVGLVLADAAPIDTGAPARGWPWLGVWAFCVWCAVPVVGCVDKQCARRHTFKL
ncbi:hypothetical protein V6D40_08740 [Corynebacterium sp. Q4381]|uniref:hypothetical protein n=1 Tax=Corynebacterium sp. Marseille-Q4381 TaxID=3121597 RepID=UPI002FE5691A